MSHPRNALADHARDHGWIATLPTTDPGWVAANFWRPDRRWVIEVDWHNGSRLADVRLGTGSITYTINDADDQQLRHLITDPVIALADEHAVWELRAELERIWEVP